MEQMNEQVKSLVLGYFSMINASVTENSGLFDISIPNEHQKFFRKDNLMDNAAKNILVIRY